MPKTRLGWWSLWLIVTMPVLFLTGSLSTNLLYQSVPAGNTILEDIVTRPALALTMLIGMLCGIFAFITGILAIIRQKERTRLVYFATFIGFLLSLFLLGEFIFPH